jgi:hypothetical protein
LIDDVGNAATVNIHAVANEIVPRLGLVKVLGKAYPKEIKFENGRSIPWQFSFGRFLEYNALALDVFFGVQRFSFGRFLEYNALALDVFLEFNALALDVFWSTTL